MAIIINFKYKELRDKKLPNTPLSNFKFGSYIFVEGNAVLIITF